MRRVMAALGVAAMGLAGASGSPGAAASSTTTAGSCGVTPVRSDGGLPAWTATARPPAGVPYVVSSRGDVVAILFGYPLRHGHPTLNSNKILWIMREGRNGQPLHLVARPLHRTSPTVRIVRLGDSGPGEIYPSTVDVPSAGCWHVTLVWNHHRAAVDLRYT